MAGVGLLVAVGAAVLVPAVAHGAPTSAGYAAVVDAGSSGTRLALYQRNVTPGDPPAVVFNATPATAALSSFTTNPSQAGPQAITPLLTQLDAYLQTHTLARAEVPVAILATAGMRLVHQSQPLVADEIMASAQSAIPAAGLPVGRVAILTGSDEALYAWVDANALSGTIANGTGGTGIVEAGGASAQAAFATPMTSGPAVRSIAVAGHTFHVVATSYLGLSVNQARSSMATSVTAAAACYPNNHANAAPGSFVVTPTITVLGPTADYSTAGCGREMDGVVHTVGGDAQNLTDNSGVAPSHLRQIAGFSATHFIGLGSVRFVLTDFGATGPGDQQAQLSASVTTHCVGRDAWGKVVTLFTGATGSFVQTACSDAAYIQAYVFGTSGIGVAPAHLTGVPNFGGPVPTWSRGYALSVLG